MGDFIKDLNIIDFLGILLPGSLYVMAAREFMPVEELLGYFGEDPGSVARITFLLVAGYVVGIILSEIGDLFEKLLWRFSRLDPRTYAAENTGLTQRVNPESSEALKEIRQGDCTYLAVIPNRTDMRKRVLFEGFRMMARNLALVLLLLLRYPGIKFPSKQPHALFYGIACAVLLARYYHYSYLKYKYAYEDYLKGPAPSPN